MALQGLHRMNTSIRGGDYARKYNYSINFTSPSGMTAASENMFMRCESFGFPGQNISTSPDDLRLGPAREHAIGVTYAPLTATFLSTENFWERSYFTEWHKLIFDGPEDGATFRMKYYNKYVTDIDVVQYDDRGKSTYAIKLIDSFPKTIVQQDVALADSDFHRMSIEFVYHFWKEVPAKGDEILAATEGKGGFGPTTVQSHISSKPRFAFETVSDSNVPTSRAHTEVPRHVAPGGAISSNAHPETKVHVADDGVSKSDEHGSVKSHVASGGVLISPYNRDVAGHVQGALTTTRHIPPTTRTGGGPS